MEARGQPGGRGSEEVPGDRENHHSVPSAKRGPAHTSHMLSFPTVRRSSLWGTNRSRTEKWPGVGNKEVSGVSTGATVGQAGESVEVRT